MKIAFLTLGNVDNIDEPGIYTDLIRELSRAGHSVTIIEPLERRNLKLYRAVIENNGRFKILRVKMLNITKCGNIEKGLAMLLLKWHYISSIRKHLYRDAFDLVLYSTPPVTFASVIQYMKIHYKVKSFLLLKDIFPQNAVDLGVMKKNSLVYYYFRKKEVELYKASDIIGCMSEANRQYLIHNNPYIKPENVIISPNSITTPSIPTVNRIETRRRFGIPEKAVAFVCGGNFGLPQDIDFIIELIKENQKHGDRHFVFCGFGTQYYKLQKYAKESVTYNVSILSKLDKFSYWELLSCCDVGLLFLNHRFTVPNFPSRLLDYLSVQIPVIALTDEASDIKQEIIKGKFGWWESSESVILCKQLIDSVCKVNRSVKQSYGINGRKYLEKFYNVQQVSHDIINSIEIPNNGKGA